jgi:hypothetical protein
MQHDAASKRPNRHKFQTQARAVQLISRPETSLQFANISPRVPRLAVLGATGSLDSPLVIPQIPPDPPGSGPSRSKIVPGLSSFLPTTDFPRRQAGGCEGRPPLTVESDDRRCDRHPPFHVQAARPERVRCRAVISR